MANSEGRPQGRGRRLAELDEAFLRAIGMDRYRAALERAPGVGAAGLLALMGAQFALRVAPLESHVIVIAQLLVVVIYVAAVFIIASLVVDDMYEQGRRGWLFGFGVIVSGGWLGIGWLLFRRRPDRAAPPN